jgi:hypothetical protein
LKIPFKTQSKQQETTIHIELAPQLIYFQRIIIFCNNRLNLNQPVIISVFNHLTSVLSSQIAIIRIQNIKITSHWSESMDFLHKKNPVSAYTETGFLQ